MGDRAEKVKTLPAQQEARIHEDIGRAKNMLNLLRKELKEGTELSHFEAARKTWEKADAGIREAAAEYEHAGVPKAQEILDIEKRIEEEHRKLLICAAVAAGEAALTTSKSKLAADNLHLQTQRGADGTTSETTSAPLELSRDAEWMDANKDVVLVLDPRRTRSGAMDDVECARKLLMDATFFFASAHAVPCYEEFTRENGSVFLGIPEQEHKRKIQALQEAIDEEIERLSCWSAGEAALAAARCMLLKGDVAGAKEERATAVYAFEQAKTDRRIEMTRLNDQIVQLEQQQMKAAAERAVERLHLKMAVKDFEGARAAWKIAARAAEMSKDDAKVDEARKFHNYIATQELHSFEAAGDGMMTAARNTLRETREAERAGGRMLGPQDVESAQEERHKAAAQYKKAEGMAVELLSAHAVARKTLLEKLSVIDGECTALEAREDEVMNELARFEAGVEAAKSALDGEKAGRQSKVGGERERERHLERERVALCAQILETENEMARIQRELQGRRKAERELDGDIEAAKALVYGAGLLKEANEGWVGIAYDKRKEFCEWRWLDALEYFNEALGKATSNAMKSEVLLCRSQVLVRLKNFQRALDDAEARVKLRPASPRSFECKAAALFGLNRKWEKLEEQGMDAQRLSDSILKLNSSSKDGNVTEAAREAERAAVRNNLAALWHSESSQTSGEQACLHDLGVSDEHVRRGEGNDLDASHSHQPLPRQEMQGPSMRRSLSPTGGRTRWDAATRQRVPAMSPFETQESPEKLRPRWRCGGREAEVHAITKKVSDARATRELKALHQLYEARARTAAASS